MCLAFDAPSLDAVGSRLEDVLEMQPPEGLVEKVKGLRKLKSIADSMPQRVRSAHAKRSC
jgi:4-hydroxy-3-polyprenylbenzoate decarboxylase